MIPTDIPGQCNARLYIGDDYGDAAATMCCQLPVGHAGLHQESFTRDTFLPPGNQRVIVTWEIDEQVDEEARMRADEAREQADEAHEP